jgi:hypothetical protein
MATKLKAQDVAHDHRGGAEAVRIDLGERVVMVVPKVVAVTVEATVYQHVTTIRCPRCKTVMRANGTRLVAGDKGVRKQLKRWVCPSAICRRTRETVGVAI